MKSKFSGIIRTEEFLEDQAFNLEKDAARLIDVAKALRKRAEILREKDRILDRLRKGEVR